MWWTFFLQEIRLQSLGNQAAWRCRTMRRLSPPKVDSAHFWSLFFQSPELRRFAAEYQTLLGDKAALCRDFLLFFHYNKDRLLMKLECLNWDLALGLSDFSSHWNRKNELYQFGLQNKCTQRHPFSFFCAAHGLHLCYIICTCLTFSSFNPPFTVFIVRSLSLGL